MARVIAIVSEVTVALTSNKRTLARPAVKRLTPIALRVASLALRTVLVVFLARYLSATDVGTYGLILGFLTFAVYAAGFDFYTYASRQIIRDDGVRWPSFIKSQFAFYAFTVSFALMLLVSTRSFEFLPGAALLWVCVLLPFEHVGQELDRILIAMGRPSSASLYLFVRQAAMPIVVLPAMAAIPRLQSLEFVLGAWVAFNGLGVLLASLKLRKLLRGAGSGRVSRRWILLGIRTSLPFLIGTLCLRALFTFDRQLVQAFSGLETLGVYTVFMAIGNGMTSLVGVAVHQFLYPGLVRSAHSRDSAALHRAARQVLVQTVLVVCAVGVVALVGLPAFLAVIDRPEYAAGTWMLWWILGAMSIYNLSLVPHLVLFSLDRDGAILASTGGAVLLFGVVAGIGAQRFGVAGVLAGLATASCWLLATKTALAIHAFRRSAALWGSTTSEVSGVSSAGS